jgi:hypothetical protein
VACRAVKARVSSEKAKAALRSRPFLLPPTVWQSRDTKFARAVL